MGNWLITGGCGFIGSSLTEQLLNIGHQVRIVDNLTVGKPSALLFAPTAVTNYKDWDRLQLVEADIKDRGTALKVVEGADTIVHLAANTGVIPSIESPQEDCETNVIGTFNYLDAARSQNDISFVFASSSAPLGDHEPPLHEELAPHPKSPYGASKLAGEAYCSAFWHSFGVRTTALRFGNAYGPGSAHKESVVARFCRRVLQGETLEIFGDGGQTRDFIYIDDIVDAIIRSGEQTAGGGEVLQIATASEHTVNEIAERIAALAKEVANIETTVIYHDARAGEVLRSFADTSKAEKFLGFRPQTSLDHGLSKTFYYMKDVLSA